MDIKKLMKQAQKMQEEILKKQEELKLKQIESSVGGGMVKIKMNGNFEVLDIIIDEEIINKDEKDMLKDLLISAFNDAKKKMDQLIKEEMGNITGGMNLPGMG